MINKTGRFLTLGFLIISFCLPGKAYSWGFFAHKHINRLAIFTLPPEMALFYKKHIEYISETAVAPDKRRYILKEEGARHFIDLDFYKDSIHLNLPLSWKLIDSIVTEDQQLKHGILPWHLGLMKHKLTEAFKSKNAEAILKLSAEIGHYLADANVPLHTCSNYNGQYTNQKGIHGLWESRLPELYFGKYNFWVGPAVYIDNPMDQFWKTVFESHNEVDSVLLFEKNLSIEFPSDQKYAFEERNGNVAKVYSIEYCSKYSALLHDQVERKMKNAVKIIGNIWYTCWVDAGQPDLNSLLTGESKIEEIIIKGVPDPEDCTGK